MVIDRRIFENKITLLSSLTLSKTGMEPPKRRVCLLCTHVCTKKNSFVTATKLGTTNIFFVAATKKFAAATKRFVNRTKHFVVVTKYFCPYFNK